MKIVKAAEGVWIHVGAATQQVEQRLSDQRHGRNHVSADSSGPIRKLAVKERASGECECQGDHEKRHSPHPVKLPRLKVGTGEEDADHVQEHGHDHQLGCSLMYATSLSFQKPPRSLGKYVTDLVVGQSRRAQS